jgi:TRAP transporter 4TM/12TM fusion protein
VRERLEVWVDRARRLLQAAMLAGLLAWLLDLPGRLGVLLYTEQYLAFAAGLAVTLALLGRCGTPRPVALGLANHAFAALVLAAFLWVSIVYPSLERSLALTPPHAIALGLVVILGVLEAVRRRTGHFLPCLLLFLVVVALYLGPELPSALATRAVSPARLTVYLAFDTNALLSRLLHVAAVTIAPFILFGALLNGFGAGIALTQRIARLVRHAPGGPAKASVLGSAGFGLVSGSAVANVTTIGGLSIPMMARAGYPRHHAAAIEAVASTGGQLLPPMMGAVAFLMAEFLEIPYRHVALAAIAPGLLFYVALYLAIDFEARHRRPAASSEISPAQPTPAAPGHPWRYLIAVAVLVHLLFVEGRSPQQAGLYATLALIACHLAWPLSGTLDRLRETCRQLLAATSTIADIVILAAAAALVIGVLNITGLAFALTLQMLELSGGRLVPMLAIAAALCIILGLGMPTVGVYVLLSTLAAPALITLGTEPIAAHLYLLYFGMLSMITPPIAIASFAAAAVAAADPWPTAFKAVRLSAAIYVIPIAFVTQPELLLTVDLWQWAVAFARCLVAIALVTAATIGAVARPLGWPTRLLALGLAAGNLAGFARGLPDGLLLAVFVSGALLLFHLLRQPARSARPVLCAPPSTGCDTSR